ncbi:MAG: CYTH domain-containing protein [Candidatus Gracilibacteria bacterium]|nr:CYTH domain-containing protein [Candidatus Gracilibacteria bacterium]MDD3646731.1 CYTH domain-containing protein [Candidatus Gracilibacteria bacterium]
MLEKEIKVLEINIDEIKVKLESFGAKKSFEGFIHDIYYDFPGDKMDTEKRIFRVRKKGETHLYTIKRKRDTKVEGGVKGIKVADEGERQITDVDSFTKVLEKYGMKKVREKKKHRISYSLDDIEFDIDDYYLGDDKNTIPPLLEIEAHSKKDINIWIKKLGLENHITKSFGSRKLFEYYGVEYSYIT